LRLGALVEVADREGGHGRVPLALTALLSMLRPGAVLTPKPIACHSGAAFEGSRLRFADGVKSHCTAVAMGYILEVFKAAVQRS
jgi:hypothetical protein